MVFPIESTHYFEYFFRRDVTKLYLSVSIRNLALGMVLLFEPIYLYLYFGRSLPMTLVFFAVMFGGFGLLSPFGGRIMATIGTTKTILVSLFFYFAYYLALFFFPVSFWLVPLSIVFAIVGMALFWPAFHVDFARFSSQKTRGSQVGKMNVMSIIPVAISPALGGWILASLGYPALFAAVLVVLIASALPLFYCKETHEVYSDSYQDAWKRAFKKENWGANIGFVSAGLESVIYMFFWPLFLFFVTANFDSMGGIVSGAFGISVLFMLYIGKVANTKDRSWILQLGSVWTAISWVLKYFIITPFDAFLTHTLYRISSTAASIPFQTLFYEKAAAKGQEADEFLVYREIIMNMGRFVFLMVLAGVFFLFPSLPIHATFFAAAVFSLGLMFLGKTPKFSLLK
jgi:MFS family permease